MKKISVLFALLAFASIAQAGALINQALPTNAYITKGGYDIAWASPCAASPSNTCSVIDLSYQSQFGWAVLDSTLFAQLNIHATDFVFAGANVDYGTGNNYDELSGASVSAVGPTPPLGNVAVAAPYFNSYGWIDWQDGFQGLWSFSDSNNQGWYDTLVYRASANQSNVPEPTSIALLGLGLAGLAAMRKKAK